MLLILDIAILPAVPDIVTSSMPVKLPVNLTAVPVGAVVKSYVVTSGTVTVFILTAVTWPVVFVVTLSTTGKTTPLNVEVVSVLVVKSWLTVTTGPPALTVVM